MEKNKKNFISKDVTDLTQLQWFPYQNSKLSIWHRPKTAHLFLLKSLYNLTHLITLQSERENLEDLQKACVANGITWVHIPLEGANLPLLQRKESKKKLTQGLKQVSEVLKADEGHTILIHCAAGIHRTGVFTYSLFRILGYVIFFFPERIYLK